MNIHTRIKMLRLLCGMNQEELAFKAEVPRPSLGNYEQGTYVPRDNSLERLASVLGVEPGYLRYGSPVVSSQAWIPNLPANARRRRETIEGILRLLPDFISENRFDSAITRPLGEGGREFYFGRNDDFSCLSLVVEELAGPMLKVVKKTISVEELLEHAEVTVASFSEKDLDLQAKYSGHKGWKFDVEGISRSLWERKEKGIDLIREPLALILDALLHLTREYNLPYDAVALLREYALQKYEKLAPLPQSRISASKLLNDFRIKIESLGGTRREPVK